MICIKAAAPAGEFQAQLHPVLHKMIKPVLLRTTCPPACEKGRGSIGYPKGRNRDIKLVN